MASSPAALARRYFRHGSLIPNAGQFGSVLVGAEKEKQGAARHGFVFRQGAGHLPGAMRAAMSPERERHSVS